VGHEDERLAGFLEIREPLERPMGEGFIDYRGFLRALRDAGYAGRVADSGEGRWTIKAAIDEAVPVPVLTTALYARFSSRGHADFQNKVLSAMRYGFGGHLEKPGK
jgi:hypothetical protein